MRPQRFPVTSLGMKLKKRVQQRPVGAPAQPASRPNKAWEGRFSEATDAVVERFTASFAFDRRLYRHDIQGSIAHAEALAQIGLLTRMECRAIVRGLQALEVEMREEDVRDTPSAPAHDEDIHMHIERRLTEKIGPIGGKLHTGRSRNDQVALDLRLYLRDEARHLCRRIRSVQEALVGQAEAIARPSCQVTRISSARSPSRCPTTCSPIVKCWSATGAA